MKATIGILNVGADLSRRLALRKYRVSEKNKSAQKRYRNTPNGIAVRIAIERKYILANRRKRNAKGVVNHAVRRGELPRVRNLPCFACVDVDASAYHHQSYDRANWLRVIPLCNRCHSNVHQGILPENFPVISVDRAVKIYEIFL